MFHTRDNILVPTARQTVYNLKEEIAGDAIYFGLSWALGMAFRYESIANDYGTDYPLAFGEAAQRLVS